MKLIHVSVIQTLSVIRIYFIKLLKSFAIGMRLVHIYCVLSNGMQDGDIFKAPYTVSLVEGKNVFELRRIITISRGKKRRFLVAYFTKWFIKRSLSELCCCSDGTQEVACARARPYNFDRYLSMHRTL